MAKDNLKLQREERRGDALARNLVWAGIAAMTLTTWSTVYVHGTTSFHYFAYHLLLQPVALACFSYGILTLQPTNQPQTKVAGLERHRTVIFTIGLPAITLGTSAIVYNKYLHGYEHYKTWHAKLGLACMIWTMVQLSVGAGSTWNDGALFGGGMKAKMMWKYHRFSGYILFGLMLFTAHLGGARSEWGYNYNSDLARFVAYTFSPGLIAAGVCLRVRPSKMKFF